MYEPRYPGESWQASMQRAELDAAIAAREREAEAERAALARAEMGRAARRRAAAMTPAPPPPEPPTPEPRRYARHGGAHPHDFRMTLEESDPT